MNNKPIIKGICELQDGRTVPVYTERLPLPINTHRPSKYLIVDMESGNVYRADENDPTTFMVGTMDDFTLGAKILRRWKKEGGYY